MRDLARRRFLIRSLQSIALLQTGLLWSRNALAQLNRVWPANWFQESALGSSMQSVFGDRSIQNSDQIVVDMPPGAENGAIISLTVKTDLPDVQSITVFGEKNPVPLIGQFRFMQNGRGQYLRTRIKLAKSSEVIVVVESADKLYQHTQYIEVLKGGCD